MTPLRELVTLILVIGSALAKDVYYGNYVGDFVDRFHGIKGEVYAVDSRTVFIKGFAYDGQGPDAYFYAGSGNDYSSGFLIPNEKGSTDVLRSYNGKDLVLTLPSGKTLKGVQWISVWCRAFDVNFGEVTFPDRYNDIGKRQPCDKILHFVVSGSNIRDLKRSIRSTASMLFLQAA